jgi:hypothetical protein
VRILIDIPDHVYEHAVESTEDSRDEWDAMRAIAEGMKLDDIKEQLKELADFDTVDILVDIMRILKGGKDGETDNNS